MMNHSFHSRFTLRRTLLLLMLCFAQTMLAQVSSSNAEFPIIACIGVPQHEATPERFRELKEAGFNVSLNTYGDNGVAQAIQALDAAEKAGVKLLVKSKLINQNDRRFIKSISTHKALFAYYVSDEPKMSELNQHRTTVRALKTMDPKHPAYVNLFPNLDKSILRHIGVNNYNEYLNAATEMGLDQISFDYYPITDKGLRETWFANLESVLAHSKSTGKPFWAYVLSTPHVIYPQPTLSALRLQVYANLAYGAQGIQYFTYWTPNPDATYNYHNGPISNDGRRTKSYRVVAEMNAELKQLIPVFQGAKVQEVHHMVKIPSGTTQLMYAPKGVKQLKVFGNEGAIVSTLKNGNTTYLAIVNKDYKKSIKVQIHVENNSIVRVNKDLSTEAVKKKPYKLAAGDLLLFRL